MFGFRRKGPTSQFGVMGRRVDVVSIIRDGKVLFTGDVAKAFPKIHMEGQIFEVCLATRSGNPYFIYYICPDYYYAMVGAAGLASFGGAMKTEEFRSSVSQQVAAFLIQLLQHAFQIDARMDITAFSHNRAHTNVLSYVSSLDDWYAIQHNDAEDDEASKRKVALVNRGDALITDVIAIHRLSPAIG